MADKLMLYKYVVKNVARADGLHGHLHAQAALPGQRLGHARATSRCGRAASRSSTPSGYAGLSDIGRWYIGGLLKHAPAVLAFAAPTTNSYKRLVPGLRGAGQPGVLRSATARPPAASRSTRKSPKAKRVEFRCPDPSCNPYLAFSAMLMAGLDGVQNRIEPPDPVDKDLYDLPPEELAKVPQVPGSLDEALARPRGRPRLPEGRRRVHRRPHRDLDRLQADATRSTPIRLRPHPWEFMLYYDI